MYNISTKQRNSVPRVIGLEGKGIPMTNDIIATINEQGRSEGQPDGLIFGDMNNLTTILDLEPSNEEGEEPEFDDDDASDQSYHPQEDDDSVPTDDHNMNPNQYEEAGVDDIAPDELIVNGDDDPMLEELNVVEEEDIGDDTSIVEANEGGIDEIDEGSDPGSNPSEEEEEEEDDRPRMQGLDGNYWNRRGEANYCLSIIKGFGNLEATLSTPQYGFKKGLTVFGGPGYDATIKELDENLIGRDVICLLYTSPSPRDSR